MRSASFVAAVAAFSSDLVTCQTPASGPTTTRITFSGNGCPQGPSARTGGFSDGVYTFNHFAASYPGTNSTVNCQAHINASGSSPGWQVALSTLDAKGHVVLDPGTTLNYYTTVFWSASASATTTVKGSISNDGASTLDYPITIHQTIPTSKLLWSDCTGDDGAFGILNVNFRPALTSDGGNHAYAEIFNEKLSYVWRRC